MNRFGKSPISKVKKVTQPKLQPEKAVITNKTQKNIQNNFNHSNIPTQKQTIKSHHNSLPRTQKSSSHHTERTTYQNNDWSEGNILSGSGVYFMSEEKLEYKGQFKNGLFDGTGTIVDILIPYRQLYKGEWKEGKKHGKGTYHYSDTEKYEGDWQENQKNGYGEYESSEGVFKGYWKNDKKNGDGSLKMKKGISLMGKWENDEFIEGKIIYSDGSMYNGKLVNYCREEKGQYEYANESKYKGEWLNNERNGKGLYEFGNGDIYEGGFAGGQKEGSGGVYRWKEGSQIRNALYVGNMIKSGEFYDVGESSIRPRQFSVE